MDKSPFSRLSAEIRNSIYELTLLNDDGPIWVMRKDPQKDGPLAVSLPGTGPPALLETCRRIRSEASAVYYGGNEFNIACIYDEIRDGQRRSQERLQEDFLTEWFRVMGKENCGLLRKVTVAGDAIPRNETEDRAARLKLVKKASGLDGGKLKVYFPVMRGDLEWPGLGWMSV